MKRKDLFIKIVPYLFIIFFAMICYFSQEEKSVTVDEFSHFPSGIYSLLTLDWRMDHESPPLIKCLPAITSIITQPKINPKLFEREPNPWNLGYHFMYNNQNDYQNIFRYGRCVIILIGCWLGWLIYTFGAQLYGKAGGLLALFLYILNPNIIAHSGLTTIDIGTSCFIFISIYYYWKFLKKKDLPAAILSGVSLGFAQLSKFTALLLYPIFIIIIFILAVKRIFFKNLNSCNHNKHLIIKDIVYILTIILVSLLVINAGYLFSGTFTQIGDYHFISAPLNKISLLIGGTIPLPLPHDYISGFDSQLAISAGDNPFYISYLMGEHSLNGWWYYYIIAFIVKNPLVFLLVLPIAIVASIKKGGLKTEDNLCIWTPIIIFFLYFSLFTHIPIGIRFLLPVFPLLCLATGNIIKMEFLKKKIGKIGIPLLAICYLIPSIMIYPNYLSYFNIIAGGPDNGHRWLIDSNLDWGQDLPGLKKYMEENGIVKIKLGYFGRVDPGIYGIEYSLPDRQPEEGIYGISINFLVGRPYYLLKNDSKELVYIDLNYFDKYKFFKPIKIINNTMYIFRISNIG